MCQLLLCRLRAAVFVNLVAMREAVSLHGGNGLCTLSDFNLRKLQQANYLYHAALNGCLAACNNYGNVSKVRSGTYITYIPMQLRSSAGGHEQRRPFVESASKIAQAPWLSIDMQGLVLLAAQCWFGHCPKIRADHICLDLATRINPLMISCYMDEDAATGLSKEPQTRKQLFWETRYLPCKLR